MKTTLQDYFNHNQIQHISVHDKAQIYSQFLNKRQNDYKKSRISNLYKSIAYSFSLLAVVLAIFLGNPGGILDRQPSETQQFVSAQTIGEITSSQGDYVIMNIDQRPIAGTLIQPGDTVIVDENAYINVLVHDAFTAQVYGPSKFEIVLQPDHASYSLKFINGGDNFDFATLAQTDKIVNVWTSDGLVIANDDNTTLSFSVKKDNTSRAIINKSDKKLEIQDSHSDEEKLTILAKHTVKLAKDDAGNVLILTQEEFNEDKDNIDSGDLILVQTPLAQDKEIPVIITKTEITAINQILDKYFLRGEYDDLLLNYFLGKDNEYTITIDNINKRLDRLADVVQLQHQSAKTLVGLVNYAYSIIKAYEHYHIDPAVYNNLIVMMNNIDTLPHYAEYGFLAETNKIKTITIDDIYKIFTIKNDINHTYF